jgi:PPM family protein phosphatase
MGGRTGGGMAAEQVVSTCSQLFEQLISGESPADLLAAAVVECHSVIRLLSMSEDKDPHSTMVAMVMTPNTFHWVHVGDSRLYVFRHGFLKEVTKDHSYVMDAIMAGKLTPEQALTHPHRNLLTSALGSVDNVRYGVGKLNSPQAGDTFLLATDGLWAYFTNAELCRILTRMTPKAAAKLLVDLARDRAKGAGDNLSLIIVKLQSPDSTILTSMISET